MAFHPEQAGMAIFLLLACLFNGWFVYKSAVRVRTDAKAVVETPTKERYRLLTYAVLAMALFDIPWVWLCMIQCWNNMFSSYGDSFRQDSGNDGFGCTLMGWYSSFSLVAMMGSHCVVAFYLKKLVKHYNAAESLSKGSFLETTRGFLVVVLSLLVVAILFGSMPLMQGDGYYLTNGGFCYADFTNGTQATVILVFVLFFLSASTIIWCKIGEWVDYWFFFAVFFCTWILWVPAAIYGMATGEEFASPYMIIGAIIGHSNALINPVLYGVLMFATIDRKTQSERKGEKEIEDC